MTTNENIEYRADRRRAHRVEASLAQVAALALAIGLLSVLGSAWVTAQFLVVHKIDRHPGSAGVEDVDRNERGLKELDAKLSQLKNLEPKVQEVANSIVTVQAAVKLQAQTMNDALAQHRQALIGVDRRLAAIERILEHSAEKP